MEVLKGMNVLCGERTVNRYAYHLDGKTYVRLEKHWYEASKSDCPIEYQYVLGRQLEEIEENMLEEEMEREKNTGRSFSYTPSNVFKYYQ